MPEDVATQPLRLPALLPGRLTFLEAQLPFRELSLIAKADRRAKDPAYGSHSWFARRPPGSMRGLLLGAALPADASASDYWRLFNSSEPILAGLLAHDPFAGGGTILVEAARLGAKTSGMDVDPLAVNIVKHELAPPNAATLQVASRTMLAYLKKRCGHLYAPTKQGWTPLHYFYLHEVTCPGCDHVDVLYRDLVIARDVGKRGAVVRDASVIAFCPDCLGLHELHRAEQQTLRCCGRRHRLYQGTYRGQSFRCTGCGTASTHARLKTGAARRRLVAIEETHPDHYRRIREPLPADAAQLEMADRYVNAHEEELRLATGRFAPDRIDGRPVTYGIERPRELLTNRQQVVFGLAFSWLHGRGLPRATQRALALGVSSALATNNRLCSYARDYGRVAPLFSVRGYAIPSLSVELNPLHPDSGRGTLARTLQRLEASGTTTVRRYIWCAEASTPKPKLLSFDPARSASGVRLCSADDDVPTLNGKVDICVFDPPYYDYIAYSELSEFNRAWLRTSSLGGEPLLPTGKQPIAHFGNALGRCLQAITRRLKPGRPLAFTYHSASRSAWDAVAKAIDKAHLRVTGLWPLRNDVRMGHHSSGGNCEWDLVIVCRPAASCVAAPGPTLDDWTTELTGLPISDADSAGMALAAAVCQSRFGRPVWRE